MCFKKNQDMTIFFKPLKLAKLAELNHTSTNKCFWFQLLFLFFEKWMVSLQNVLGHLKKNSQLIHNTATDGFTTKSISVILRTFCCLKRIS